MIMISWQSSGRRTTTTSLSARIVSYLNFHIMKLCSAILLATGEQHHEGLSERDLQRAKGPAAPQSSEKGNGSTLP